jgi:uncharacterized membrane protein
MHPDAKTDRGPAIPRKRIEALDLARGLALVAMAVYHFAWDLEFFGYAPPGMTAMGGWKLFARCIASSFLFLVGVSLFLAHYPRVRWPSFLRRLAMVAGAAAAISVATYFAVPDAFIFFGILHQIALASLLGLAFLRLPALLTLAVAIAVIAAPIFLRSSFFDQPALWGVGLSTIRHRSNDYVPLFPWFSAVLIGIAGAKIASAAGLFDRLADVKFGRWSAPLGFFGRHSLAFYLFHQPVLIGAVWLFAQVFPPQVKTEEISFRQTCEATCQQSRDEAFCARYCACMLDELVTAGDLPRLFSGEKDEALNERVSDMAATCTAAGEDDMTKDTAP